MRNLNRNDKESTVPIKPKVTVPQLNYAERTVIAGDGVRLAVRDYNVGSGGLHTAVLLHGLCLTQDSWALQVRLLTHRWGSSVRIISYDHRGHGRSTGAPMHTYRVERLAEDLADVLTALRVTGPLTLAGHSLGGMTALAYVSRPHQPVQPDGLVLVASAAGRLCERGLGRLLATPAPRVLFDLVNRLPRRSTEQTIRSAIGPLRAALTGRPGCERPAQRGLAALAVESTRAVSPATAAGFLLNLRDYDVYECLSSISATTVVVSGGADMTTPDAHAHDLVAAIPGALHVRQPAAGHMLLLDAPHCVATAINRAMHLQPGAKRTPTTAAC